MSSKRESFAHRSRNLLPLSAIWDFPIPTCKDCGGQMVKLEAKWGCKACTKITMLRASEMISVNGEPVVKVLPVKMPLGEAYPNRASRRSIRR